MMIDMRMIPNMREVGIIVIVISVILVIDIWSITDQLMRVNSILHKSCNLPEQVCPFVGVPPQSIVGFAVLTGLIIFGIYLIIVSKQSEKITTKMREDFQQTINSLKGDEKRLYEVLVEHGAMFQSDLAEKLGMNKVKVSRILDKMEGRGIIERRRRGMANMIVPKKTDF